MNADNLFKRAALSFVRAFAASILVLAPGILAAPNLDAAYGLGVAGLIASFTAAIAAIQVFVPQITWGHIAGVYGRYLDSFTRAFLGSLLVLGIGVLNSPNLHAARAAGVAALVGAFAAGLKALQELATKGTLTSEPSLGS